MHNNLAHLLPYSLTLNAQLVLVLDFIFKILMFVSPFAIFTVWLNEELVDQSLSVAVCRLLSKLSMLAKIFIDEFILKPF